jgi:hypothetical protein
MAELNSAARETLDQAERLFLEAETKRFQQQHERHSNLLEVRRQHLIRVHFLRDHDALPMDIQDYDTWLTGYVATGQRIDEFVYGAFPRAFDNSAAGQIYNQVAQQLGMQPSGLDDDYYANIVFWSIDMPLHLDDIPALTEMNSLSLHLSAQACRDITPAAAQAWAADDTRRGGNRLLVDGHWEGERWVSAPYAVGGPVVVWAESISNLRGETRDRFGLDAVDRSRRESDPAN